LLEGFPVQDKIGFPQIESSGDDSTYEVFAKVTSWGEGRSDLLFLDHTIYAVGDLTNKLKGGCRDTVPGLQMKVVLHE